MAQPKYNSVNPITKKDTGILLSDEIRPILEGHHQNACVRPMAQNENSNRWQPQNKAPEANLEPNSGVVCDYCEFVIPERLFAYCPRCRDQFAMAAPHEEIEICLLAAGEQRHIELVCKARYGWADAMLAARKPK